MRIDPDFAAQKYTTSEWLMWKSLLNNYSLSHMIIIYETIITVYVRTLYTKNQPKKYIYKLFYIAVSPTHKE